MGTKQSSNVRIIAGQWRGRKLPVINVDGLRPTTDRVRETLFNWLMTYLPGSRCLDLFAGTGVLGLEAVSRGAEQALLVEKNKQVVLSLQGMVSQLNATNEVQVLNIDAMSLVGQVAATSYDVVFVDPPYQLNCQSTICQQLESNGWLTDEAFVAIEVATGAKFTLPENWQQHRELRAGQSTMLLYRRKTLK